MKPLKLYFRGWCIEATDHDATCAKFDGSEERFECHRQADFENTIRMAKAKVNRLEGDQIWNEAYQNEALK